MMHHQKLRRENRDTTSGRAPGQLRTVSGRHQQYTGTVCGLRAHSVGPQRSRANRDGHVRTSIIVHYSESLFRDITTSLICIWLQMHENEHREYLYHSTSISRISIDITCTSSAQINGQQARLLITHT